MQAPNGKGAGVLPKSSRRRAGGGRALAVAGVEAGLVARPAFGHRRAYGRAPGFGKMDSLLRPGRRNSTISGSVENERLMRVSRSLHGLWRKAVRAPVNSLRARIRDAVAARKQGGLPVSVDETTALKPSFRSRAGCRRRARNAPSSKPASTGRGSTRSASIRPRPRRCTTSPHTVDAPAMTLEHLVDQFWFPKLGLLISKQGLHLAPFLPRTVPVGLSHLGQGDRSTGRGRTEPGRRSSSRNGFPALRLSTASIC